MGCGLCKARVSPEQELCWRAPRTYELEAALRSGAIRLLDGGWLVACAKRGERIRRRQDLPAKAFISLEELKAATFHGLPIICLSYAWLHPDHPVSRLASPPPQAPRPQPSPPSALPPRAGPQGRAAGRRGARPEGDHEKSIL